MSKDETSNSDQTVSKEVERPTLNTHQIETHESADTGQNPQNNPRQTLKFAPRRFFRRYGLTITLIIVYLTQAYYMREQWKIMRGQLAEIREGSKDTKVIAEAVKNQADAATASVKAWIAVEGWNPGGIKDNTPLLEVVLKNIGKTPAFDVRTTQEILFIRDPTRKYRHKFGSCPTRYETRPGTIQSDRDWATKIETSRLSDADAKMLVEGTARLWIHGCVKFGDIFSPDSHDRVTEFAVAYPTFSGSTTGVSIHSPYNRMK